MTELVTKTNNNTPTAGKPKVCLTCHPGDATEEFIDDICRFLFRHCDVTVYYRKDMSEDLAEEERRYLCDSMNIFIVPVTGRFLREPNIARDRDIKYLLNRHEDGRENKTHILPLMMERGLTEEYSAVFGSMQFTRPPENYAEKGVVSEMLTNKLNIMLGTGHLISDIREMSERYIFLSYRKKNRDQAIKLMRKIQEDRKYHGIGIWFDDYLIPGENYNDDINEALTAPECGLVLLVVTPDVLGHNYVRDKEYPAALASGKKILPVIVTPTDTEALKSEYSGLAEVTDIDSPGFGKALDDAAADIIDITRGYDAEHDYLIGRSYLSGLFVLKDPEIGIEHITEAAYSGCFEAAKWLFNRCYSAGIFDGALFWAEKAYGICTDGRSPAAKDKYIVSLGDLCTAYISAQKYDKALAAAEEYYRLASETDDDDILTARASHLYALALLSGKELEEKDAKYYESVEKARVLARRSYEAFCAAPTFGPNHHETLTAKHILAQATAMTGRTEEAIVIYNELLDSLAPTEETGTILRVKHNLGGAYSDICDYARATELLTECYHEEKKLYGEFHPSTIFSLNLLGDFEYCMTGSTAVKEQSYEACLKGLAKGHTATHFILTGLADILLNSDKYSEKHIDYILDYYELCREARPEDRRETLRVLKWLSAAYEKTGLYYLSHLIDTEAEAPGSEHISRLGISHSYEADHGISDEYIDRLRGEYLESLEETNDIMSERAAQAADSLTSVLYRAGRFDEYVEFFEARRDIAEDSYDEYPPVVRMFTMIDLAKAYSRAGYPDDALGTLERYIDMIEQTHSAITEHEENILYFGIFLLNGCRFDKARNILTNGIRSLRLSGRTAPGLEEELTIRLIETLYYSGDYPAAIDTIAYYNTHRRGKLTQTFLKAQEMYLRCSYENGFCATDPEMFKKALALDTECSRMLAPADPVALGSKMMLSLYLAGQGRFAEADACIAHTLETCAKGHGFRSLTTLEALRVTADIYLKKGNYHTALLFYRKCRALIRSFYPGDLCLVKLNELTARVLYGISFSYTLLNYKKEAADSLEECYRYSEEWLGGEHTITLKALDYIALNDCSVKDYENAVRKHEKCFSVMFGKHGYFFGPVIEALKHLATDYCFIGEAGKATELYRGLCEALVRENSPITAEYAKECVAECERHFGKNSPEALKADELLLWVYSTGSGSDRQILELCDTLTRFSGELSDETVDIIRAAYIRCNMPNKAASL